MVVAHVHFAFQRLGDALDTCSVSFALQRTLACNHIAGHRAGCRVRRAVDSCTAVGHCKEGTADGSQRAVLVDHSTGLAAFVIISGIGGMEGWPERYACDGLVGEHPFEAALPPCTGGPIAAFSCCSRELKASHHAVVVRAVVHQVPGVVHWQAEADRTTAASQSAPAHSKRRLSFAIGSDRKWVAARNAIRLESVCLTRYQSLEGGRESIVWRNEVAP